MTDFAKAYDALGGAPSILTVVEAVLEREAAVVFPTRAKHYVALTPEEGAQVALYAERTVLALALDPRSAADISERTGTPYVRKTPATWYLRASATELTDAAVAHAITEAGVLAIRRCRDRFVADRVAGRVISRPDPGVCLTCNLQVLPSEACGTDACEI